MDEEAQFHARREVAAANRPDRSKKHKDDAQQHSKREGHVHKNTEVMYTGFIGVRSNERSSTDSLFHKGNALLYLFTLNSTPSSSCYYKRDADVHVWLDRRK